ncbi:MAG: translation initiation factor IF-2 [Candidatus Aminicenantes bacterium]|nr:translation initiation factor IF-2 [Candidatus Aminicenantes bacterium]
MVKKTTTPPKQAEATPAKPKPKLVLREALTLKDAAVRAKVTPKDLSRKLQAKGLLLNPQDILDESVVPALAQVLGRPVEMLTIEKEMEHQALARTEDMTNRPPVVTIMGHVDHGKTTLLDAIRSSHLVDKESGGITQHIGAYRVVHNNRAITFIDTPGHEAFTQLRARGAKVTDIVILVIAADDGLMAQTREAINHARDAGVPMIIAINKVDKPEANLDRVKQQLSKEGILVEDYGGDVISVEVSAKQKTRINDLLDMIILLSDMLEIKANPKGPAQGIVLEARLDPKKGPLATVIVQNGTLHPGDAFVAGVTSGKVRALFDEHGKTLVKAGPSLPVEVLGFADVPLAGNLFQVVPDGDAARTIAGLRRAKVKKDEPVKAEHITLDDLFKRIEGGDLKELPLVVRADVQGSVEVLLELLPSLSGDKVKVKIVQAATGPISESDILLASAANAVVIGYSIKPAPKIQAQAKEEGVEIRTYDVIYQLTEDIKKAMDGLLEPVIRETYLGRAQVRKVFQIPRVGAIAGCLVVDGKITRGAEARILRGNETVLKSRVSSLKHLKENVAEVKKDLECGIGVEKFKDFQEGDVIEAFVTEKVKAV